MSAKEELITAIKKGGGVYLVETLASHCTPEDLGYALVMACYMGDIASMSVLVFHDADVRFQEDLPLRIGCRSSKVNIQVVEALLKLGSDPNAAEGHPLYYTASTGNLEVVKALLDAGAKHSYPGNPALVPASIKGHLKVVRLLVEAGADPDLGIQAIADDAVRRAFNRSGVLPSPLRGLGLGLGLGLTTCQLSTLDYLKGMTAPTVWEHLLA